MKYTLLSVCILALGACGDKPAQTQASSQPNVIRDSNLVKKEAANPYVPVDVSPMDMLYYPTDYPVKKMNEQAKGSPVARVIYSRPHRGGRTLFGGLVQWGQPWRLGANEATEVEFFQPVIVQKKRIEKGRYVLYAIPFQDHWTLVLNSNLFSWGLKLNPQDDVARFDEPSTAAPQLIEYFTMDFEKTASGVDLIMAWENTEVRLPIQF
ncbi:DUF2911 domain-containing protein [Flavisolibacter ginsenosidimutans]|uniref:DUF2911 domain-containing protein n=1 Tax=Flavisolibacter ginsenosidimutans TaxID=661481 RepID=A0A5B8UKK7_9BACT|nr:DUF2911 domain-containing protein [Flavisolibacter ginsenosidimutans]QEC57088.1 DUF2911 domain-containing protein [Flavisolibacter ginsenosidimutans]